MFKDVEEARQFAISVLEDFNIDKNAWVEFVKYRENHVFKAITQQENYAVRIHRRHYRSNQELQSEAYFIASLAQKGIDVPEQIKTMNGDYFLIKSSKDGEDYQIDITKWFENTQPLDDISKGFDGTSDLTAAHFFTLGQSIAKMHKITQESNISANFQRKAWDAEGLIGEKAVWGNPMRAFKQAAEHQSIQKTIEKITNEMQLYGKNDKNYGPIHADFTPENILLKDERLIIIDFDDCGFGWYIFDLATALNFYQPHKLYDDYQLALFAGYETILPLDASAKAIFPAMMLARGLTYMGWATDRLGDDAAEFLLAEFKPLLLAKAKTYIGE